jgi:hypothetical protein
MSNIVAPAPGGKGLRRPDRLHAVKVSLCRLADALSNPWLAPRLGYSMNQAYAAARGLGNGIEAQCITCRQPWGVRRPSAVAQVTARSPDPGVMVALVCDRCAAHPRTARRKLREITKQGLRLVPISALAPGGRA